MSKSVILVHHATKIDQAVVCFVVLNSPNEKKPLEIEKDLRQDLTLQMVPQVLLLDCFPHLTNGKVDRQSLLKIYVETKLKTKSETQVLFKSPRYEIENENAKKVLEIITHCLGNELRGKVTTASNFFELGGNSMNTTYTVLKLQENGFFIKLSDFIKSSNLDEVLKKIISNKPKSTSMHSIIGMKLHIEPITNDEEEKNKCIDLISEGFYYKGDIEQFVEGLKVEHYKDVLNEIWDSLVASGLCFLVKNEAKKLVGFNLSFDIIEAPKVESISRNNVVTEVFSFLNAIEKPVL